MQHALNDGWSMHQMQKIRDRRRDSVMQSSTESNFHITEEEWTWSQASKIWGNSILSRRTENINSSKSRHQPWYNTNSIPINNFSNLKLIGCLEIWELKLSKDTEYRYLVLFSRQQLRGCRVGFCWICFKVRTGVKVCHEDFYQVFSFWTELNRVECWIGEPQEPSVLHSYKEYTSWDANN